MKIMGLNKLTLLDYPNKMAAAIFLGGCNFDCGFCHNSSLINPLNDSGIISKKEVLEFLDKRKNVLEGVCITGGEPLLFDIEPFILDIKKIKDYKIKIDTNGTSPDKLQHLLEKNIASYVAMDIKNSFSKYTKTIGVRVDLQLIKKSIDLIKTNAPDYEFRTTLIKEYHTHNDFLEMLKMIEGAKRYALQTYIESDEVRQKGLSSFSENEMKEFSNIAKDFVEEVLIR